MPENKQEGISWGGAIKGFVGMAVAGALLTAVGAAIGMPWLGLAAKFLFAGSGLMLASPLLQAGTRAIGSFGRSTGSSHESQLRAMEEGSIQHSQQQANAQNLQLPPGHKISELAQQLSASAQELSKALSQITTQQRLDADGNRITKLSNAEQPAQKRVDSPKRPSAERLDESARQAHERALALQEELATEAALEREFERATEVKQPPKVATKIVRFR